MLVVAKKFDSEQLSNARRVIETLKPYRSPLLDKAALATILVESGGRNINHGDRDSLGLFQQRPSQGWGSPAQVRDVEYATKSFADRAKRLRGKGLSAADVARLVQRPAKEYEGRYAERAGDAEELLRLVGGSRDNTVAKSKTQESAATPIDKGALARDYLSGKPSFGKQLAYVQAVTAKPAENASTGSKKSALRGEKGLGSNQDLLDKAARIAQKYGLKVGEHSKYGGVAPVHTKGSYHYKDQAFDASGSPEAMAKAAAEIDRLIGGRIKELFYNGGKGNINRDNGKRVPKGFVPGHTDHLHFAG